MSVQGKAGGTLTPEQEDRALFKTYGGPIAVDLIPQAQRNARGDMVIRGFFNSKFEIEVVFSGRRTAEVGPLIAQLKTVDRNMRQTALSGGRPEPRVDQIRLPVQIKGSWRHHFNSDAEGQDAREYQLVAARWAYADKSGNLEQFGEAPACAPQAKTRRKSYILNAREFDAVQNSSAVE